jgi:light-regulated signal transduction histidine kinase (bacteriophytochrome)
MEVLIDDLLSYARLRTTASTARVDCNEVVTDVMAMLVDDVKTAEAEVAIGPLPTLTADPGQVRQLFLNLLGNALKFHRPGVPSRVTVEAARTETGWVFQVADNGIGIKPESRDRIFKMFQRLHGPAEFPGTGIGLSICRRVADNHGGRIWVEASASGGAAFNVLLPEDSCL